MKLALLSIFDATNVQAWSGLGTYILIGLNNAGFQTEPICIKKYKNTFVYKIKDIYYNKLIHRTYLMLWDKLLLRGVAQQINTELSRINPDVIFSIWPIPIANLDTNKPMVFWADATFVGLTGFYPTYNNLCSETIRNGNRVEQLALSKCRLAIYSSEWAADSAIEYYGADPGKVRVVPFGANINCTRTDKDIREILDRNDFETCNLLFIGKDWQRKGGSVAVEVAKLLNKKGLRTALHLVGCNPRVQLPDFVKLYGYISKETVSGRRQLDELFAQAHFFLLPTRADCTPVVFPEACSFGLPILTTNVGGIPTQISEGVNGYTFSLEAPAEAYCEVIERLWNCSQEYKQLALSSFREYEHRLNWKTSGRKVAELLDEFCG
jgi:glycosyltransferase involved in cell wall biosynthesis